MLAFCHKLGSELRSLNWLTGLLNWAYVLNTCVLLWRILSDPETGNVIVLFLIGLSAQILKLGHSNLEVGLCLEHLCVSVADPIGSLNW